MPNNLDQGRPIGATPENGFVRALGLFDGTMMVVGSMIGAGIFIVAADITRLTGSAGGLLLTWILTGLLTVAAALSYGELAALFPYAGGQYAYLREAYSPLWGFLYGWALFLVIQTGTIAAVGIGFARYLGVLIPTVSPDIWLIRPIPISIHYAISLSVQQLVAILMIAFLTLLNARGIRLGKLIQNAFSTVKMLILLGIIIVGIIMGKNSGALAYNFSHPWAIREARLIGPTVNFLSRVVPSVSAATGAFGVFVAFAAAQTGSLFSADCWNNIGFTAAEVKNPRRDVALSMTFGTIIVTILFCLANFGYLCVLRLPQIQSAPDDRVATAAMAAIFGRAGAAIMAVGIVIATFGCNNGLILSGARVYYAMAHDRLFFRSLGTLNKKGVPASALLLQSVWITVLILVRSRHLHSGGVVTYGNLYSDLLEYVVFTVLMFYVLTVAGIFRLRRSRPDAERPYRALGYPFVPLLYIAAAVAIMSVLLLYKTQTSWPGLAVVLLGVPVYVFWRRNRVAIIPEVRLGTEQSNI
jgi:APA family basic amino acid/polyamine antiporter